VREVHAGRQALAGPQQGDVAVVQFLGAMGVGLEIDERGLVSACVPEQFEEEPTNELLLRDRFALLPMVSSSVTLTTSCTGVRRAISSATWPPKDQPARW
jgi:hypothetical protein